MRKACAWIVMSALLASCTSDNSGSSAPASRTRPNAFAAAPTKVPIGTAKADVMRTLGRPDARTSAIAGDPAANPPPPASVSIGSRYEHWIYHRDGNDYHLILGPSPTHPGRWEVLDSTVAKPAASK